MICIQATYPLTPGTPISNLATPSFFATQDDYEGRESFTGETAAIPTATDLIHHLELHKPRRTISQNLRELKSITEGRSGLMREIDTEISHRRHHHDKKKKRISSNKSTDNQIMAAEHTRSEQECPTSIIVDNRTDEHGNDDSNINNNHMNENEIEDNHKEEEEQPLLQVREQLKYLMILVDSLYCNMQNTGKIPAKCGFNIND